MPTSQRPAATDSGPPRDGTAAAEAAACRELLADGRLVEAAARASAAIEVRSPTWQLLDILCVAASRAGDGEELQRCLPQLAAAAPPEASRRVARHTERLEQLQAKSRRLARATAAKQAAQERRNKREAGEQRRLFATHRTNERWADGIVAIERGLALDPAFTFSPVGLLACLAEATDDHGRAWLEEQRDKEPQNPSLIEAQGRHLLQTGSLDELRTLLTGDSNTLPQARHDRLAAVWAAAEEARCRRLVRDGALDEAQARATGALAARPDQMWPLDVLCSIAAGRGDHDALEALLVRWSSSDHHRQEDIPQLERHTESLHVLRGELPLAIDVLQAALVSKNPPEAAAQVRLFSHFHDVERWKDALEALESALATAPDESFDIAKLLQCLVGAHPAEHRRVWIERQRERHPENRTLLLALARLLVTTGCATELQPLLDDSQALLDEATLDGLSSLLDATGTTVPGTTVGPQRPRRFAMMLLSEHGPEVARESILELDATKPELELAAFMRALPGDDQLRRPLVADFPSGQEWVVAGGSSAGPTVVVFTGGSGAASDIPIRLFDRYLATLDLDAIYLRDTSRHFFLGGVAGLGGSWEQAAAAVKELAPSRPSYAVSFSAGSFGATQFMRRAAPAATVMFSPYTYLAGNSNRQAAAREYLQATFDNAPSDLLLAMEDPTDLGSIRIVFGTDDDGVRPQVDRLAHLDAIDFVPVPDAGHQVLRTLVPRRELLPLLADRFVAG